MRKSFDVPDEVIVDMETGLTLNLPVTVQESPGWWNREPEKYLRIIRLRQERGIVVDDFPKGTDRIVSGVTTWAPMTAE